MNPTDKVRVGRDLTIVILFLCFLTYLTVTFRKHMADTETKWSSLRTAIYMDAMEEVRKSKEES